MKKQWIFRTIMTLACLCGMAAAQETTSPAPAEKNTLTTPEPTNPTKAPEDKGKPGKLNRSMGDAQAKELLEQVMIARLSKQLNLDDAQSVILVRRFIEFRGEQQKLRKERGERMKQIKRLVEEGKDEAAVEENLNALRSIGDRMINLHQEYYDHLGIDLDTWQRGKLVVFMDQFEAEIRRLVDQVKEKRKGPNAAKKEENAGPAAERMGDKAPKKPEDTGETPKK